MPRLINLRIILQPALTKRNYFKLNNNYNKKQYFLKSISNTLTNCLCFSLGKFLHSNINDVIVLDDVELTNLGEYFDGHFFIITKWYRPFFEGQY